MPTTTQKKATTTRTTTTTPRPSTSINFVCTRGCGCFFRDRCWGAHSHSKEDKAKWATEKDLKQQLHQLRVEQTIARLLALQQLHDVTKTTTTKTTTTSTKNTGTINPSAIEAAAVCPAEADAAKKRQSEDLAAQKRKSVQEAKAKTLADEKQKRLEAAYAQALQYYEKCSDKDLRRGLCAMNKGEYTKMKGNQLVAELATSFAEHDRGLLFRPKDGALVTVKYYAYPSVDTTGAFVFTKVDSTGKTVTPPEEGYNVNYRDLKPKRSNVWDGPYS